jgi:hypothetical protein
VISKKKNSIDFLAELGLLSTVALLSYNFFPLNPESNILVLRGTYCFFNHFDEFVRVAPEQQFSFLKFLNH